MYVITKQFEFEAAHQLTKVPDGHKCRRLHGHNYVVTVELTSESLDSQDFVVDFGELRKLGQHLDDTYDHRFLNHVVPCETTAENLAHELYVWCADRWPQTSAITVAETRGTTATYRPAPTPQTGVARCHDGCPTYACVLD